MAVELDAKGQEFIANISRRLGRPTPQTPPTREFIGAPEFWLSYNLSKDEKIKQFIDTLQGLTGRAVLVKDYELLKAQVRFWLSEFKAESVMLWDTPEIQAAGIADACREAGARISVWDPTKNRREMIKECASVDVGITWAEYAISTTGSIAVFCDPSRGRSVSLLPPIHIAVANVDRLVTRMGEVLKLMASGEKTASSVNFITGPSRTSDIEMDLSVGVHGPGKVCVALLDQPSLKQ